MSEPGLDPEEFENDDDPLSMLSDEPPWGSFPEERGWDDLDGSAYDQVVEELKARELM